MKLIAIVLSVLIAMSLVLGVISVGHTFFKLEHQWQLLIFLGSAFVAVLLWIRLIVHWWRAKGGSEASAASAVEKRFPSKSR